MAIAILTSVAVGSVSAQVIPSKVDLTAARALPSPAPFQGSADTRSPALAGVLSFLIPGVGNFYAGNSAHGFVHLGIAVGALAAMVGTSNEQDSKVPAAASAVYLLNDIWSIYRAVGDANRYNAKSTSGRIIGALYLSPEVKALSVHEFRRDPGVPDHPGIGLQVLVLKF